MRKLIQYDIETWRALRQCKVATLMDAHSVSGIKCIINTRRIARIDVAKKPLSNDERKDLIQCLIDTRPVVERKTKKRKRTSFSRKEDLSDEDDANTCPALAILQPPPPQELEEQSHLAMWWLNRFSQFYQL